MDGGSGSRRMSVDTDPAVQKHQDDVSEIGQRVKHHDENVKYLKGLLRKLKEATVNMQVAINQYDTSGFSTKVNIDSADVKSERETIGHILKHERSGAALLCSMKIQAKTLSSEHSITKDMIGIVAILGKVDDDNLSRLLASYLGLETMLAVVFKTYDGVKALEAYDKEGSIEKNIGIHAFAATIGRPLAGSFHVICLEYIRPYAGEFIADDPQKRLSLQKPRLPNGETPPGFLGFAVNMITLDKDNLYYISKNGHGLRETLFYNLFLDLQVYRKRDDMLKALSCIKNGAISLDGGMVKKPGVYSLGHHLGDIGVKFPLGLESLNFPEIYFEIKNELKETQRKIDRASGDLQREQLLLDHARLNFGMKKLAFLKILGERPSHVSQSMARRGRGSTPR